MGNVRLKAWNYRDAISAPRMFATLLENADIDFDYGEADQLPNEDFHRITHVLAFIDTTDCFHGTPSGEAPAGVRSAVRELLRITQDALAAHWANAWVRRQFQDIASHLARFERTFRSFDPAPRDERDADYNEYIRALLRMRIGIWSAVSKMHVADDRVAALHLPQDILERAAHEAEAAGLCAANSATSHSVEELSIPSRYEQLERLLDQASLQEVLFPPGSDERETIEHLVDMARVQSTGAFVPILGNTGAGKSTFVKNLHIWFESAFSPSVDLPMLDELTVDNLLAATSNVPPGYAGLILPLNVDQRERRAPNDREIGAIKEFFRKRAERRVFIFWSENQPGVAKLITDNYERMNGKSSVDLPMRLNGPPVDEWPGIVGKTVRAVNAPGLLDALQVRPDEIDPTQYDSLGAYFAGVAERAVNRARRDR